MIRYSALILVLLAIAGCTTAPKIGAVPGATTVSIPLISQKGPWQIDSQQEVTGYLFKPQGKGPFPAVVLMHGCAGLQWDSSQATLNLSISYAHRFVDHGYVALILDSFGPRNVEGICDELKTISPQMHEGVPTRVRIRDAYSAAKYLTSLNYVDPDRIIAEGLSHGAVAVVESLLVDARGLQEHFAAGIAWYPFCSYRSQDRLTAGWSKLNMVNAPLLILIGSGDDWTPAANCEAMRDRINAPGSTNQIELHVYKGATHAFDFPMAGNVVVAGHVLSYDGSATDDAWQRIDAFLKANVTNRNP